MGLHRVYEQDDHPYYTCSQKHYKNNSYSLKFIAPEILRFPSGI